jgi:RNA polymerase sigma-70 factor (sigma-E family)
MMATPMRPTDRAAGQPPPAALEQLFRERYEPMVRVAYLLTGDRAVAEELVQDAFLALHRRGARVDQPGAYLRTAVVNGCTSWGRRRTLERRRQVASPESSPFVVDEMWDALQVLPDRQRTAIVLRYYTDLPDREIASVLQCRLSTVRTTIHRGLATLRKEIER